MKNPSARWTLGVAAIALLSLSVYFWRESTMTVLKGTPVPSDTGVVKHSLPAITKSQTNPAQHFRVDGDGTVAIPTRFQLPGVGRAKSAANFKDWLAQYPTEQQDRLRAFNKQHFGVYSINSPEQVAWMAENGYPMPEDVIAAEKLSDADLREMANQGNDKAGFLLRERNIAATRAKLDAYHAQGKTTSDFWSNDPDARQLNLDYLNTTQLLQQSHSPFKGYIQTLDALLQSDQVAKDGAVIAGLVWALSLGDFRAGQFLDAYIGSDPMRQAMSVAAHVVDTNAATDSALMKSTGYQNAGVPPDMYIPGSFAPVR